MKEIQLSKGMVALVDDADFDWLNQWKWYAKDKMGFFYAYRDEIKSGKKTSIGMHRFILSVNDREILVDHKDHNTLNNQRDNIRLATRKQNQANRQSKKGSSSKFLGVTWNSTYKKWDAHIRQPPKRHSTFLGFFKTEQDAALAYNKAAVIQHGEFANLNII